MNHLEHGLPHAATHATCPLIYGALQERLSDLCVCAFFNGEKHGSGELALGTTLKEVRMGWSGLMSEIKLTRTYVIRRSYTGYNKDLYQLGCILNFFLNGIFYLCWTYTWTCTDSNVALYECPFPRKRILILT